jgi:hypothetical protein
MKASSILGSLALTVRLKYQEKTIMRRILQTKKHQILSYHHTDIKFHSETPLKISSTGLIPKSQLSSSLQMHFLIIRRVSNQYLSHPFPLHHQTLPPKKHSSQ